FVPPAFWTRAVPDNAALAVPVAACAGVVLPGCECASVPVAGGLVARGVRGAAALAFLLAAPAINPVVLVATAVAFPGRPEVVVARFSASLLAAVSVGWIWIRLGRDDLLESRRSPHVHADTRGAAFLQIAQHDFLNAGGFLIIGAATAGALQTVVPRSILTSLSGNGIIAVLAL